jgi:hypothetical protein
MRLPSMTTPDPVTLWGACLVQGLNGSGRRMVLNTLITEFSMRAETAGETVSAPAPAARGASWAWTARVAAAVNTNAAA